MNLYTVTLNHGQQGNKTVTLEAQSNYLAREKAGEQNPGYKVLTAKEIERPKRPTPPEYEYCLTCHKDNAGPYNFWGQCKPCQDIC